MGQTVVFYIGECLRAKNPAIYDPDYAYNEGVCDKLLHHYEDYFISGEKGEAQVNGITLGLASTILIMLLP